MIAAAGDIACDPGTSPFNAGNGTATKCHMKAAAAILSSMLGSAGLQRILAVGDEQYQCGGVQAFSQSYGPTWGQPTLQAITSPVPGDQDYKTTGGTDCPATPGAGYYSYFGSAAGDPSKGYYGYDVGMWHLIALNSNCGFVGGCGAVSPVPIPPNRSRRPSHDVHAGVLASSAVRVEHGGGEQRREVLGPAVRGGG